MIYARVIGNVTSTAKHPGYLGRALMIVQPLDEHGQPSGETFLAVDNAQAGPGDDVIVLQEGNGIRQILGGTPPIQRLIVGVVDSARREHPVGTALARPS